MKWLNTLYCHVLNEEEPPISCQQTKSDLDVALERPDLGQKGRIGSSLGYILA